jgi:hypothetical protein
MSREPHCGKRIEQGIEVDGEHSDLSSTDHDAKPLKCLHRVLSTTIKVTHLNCRVHAIN